MKASLSFITRTASVSDAPVGIRTAGIGARALEVIGYDGRDQKIYLLERTRSDLGDTLPQLFSIRAHGWLAGRTTPVHEFYRDDEDGPSFAARLAGFRAQLVPLVSVGAQYFAMNTRVTKRSAVRVIPESTPVRRYDVRVTVRPVVTDDDEDGKVLAMGARKTLTAYLRPRVRLAGVWAHPALEFAVALVSYVGMPYDIGYERQSAIYIPLPDASLRR